jgi:uncharacterized membrane protein YdjX (TVP38/TMEM64 family)
VTRIRAEIVDLGPLRWVALASAVLPTAGLFALWLQLPRVAAVWPAGSIGIVAAVGALGAAVALLLLPAAFSAFAAGYCLGPVAGALAIWCALPLAGWLGQHLVWPIVAAPLYPFLRQRPRIAIVSLLAQQNGWRGIAAARAAATFPFQVVTLMMSGARVRAGTAWLGTTMAAVPVGILGSIVGDAVRGYCERAEWPPLPTILVAAAAAVVLMRGKSRGRRAWAGVAQQVAGSARRDLASAVNG